MKKIIALTIVLFSCFSVSAQTIVKLSDILFPDDYEGQRVRLEYVSLNSRIMKVDPIGGMEDQYLFVIDDGPYSTAPFGIDPSEISAIGNKKLAREWVTYCSRKKSRSNSVTIEGRIVKAQYGNPYSGMKDAYLLIVDTISTLSGEVISSE